MAIELKETKIKKEETQIKYGPGNPHPLSTRKTELVWEGKYDEYGNRREVDTAGMAMPLQKIETVDEPVSKLKSSSSNKDQMKLDLLLKRKKNEDFRNMLIWGDNKLVMSSLLKDFKGTIDLIYIDPPFDVGADFTMSIPIAEDEEIIDKEQSILEMVAYRDIWGKGTDSYLHVMYERFALMKQLLSSKGSIYVHCDWRMNSYIRCVLDDVFDSSNFINEIVWKRRAGILAQSRQYGACTDTILYYSKSPDYTFHPPMSKEGTEDYITERFKYTDEKGRRYRLSPIVSPSYSPSLIYEYKGYQPPANGWSCSRETMERWEKEGKLVLPKDKSKRIQRKQYLDEWEGRPIQTLWDTIPPINPQALERVGYGTQKPEAFLKRIIESSSNEGDLIADFFCGSGTTGVVAEKLNRRWMMCDLGRYAIHTSRKRLIETQRQLYGEDKPYRSFDVYNLGRYERQWWQMKDLQGADEEHRKLVLKFYKAEEINDPPSPLIHGRKGQALVHVDNIDTLLTRDEVKVAAKSAKEAGAKEVHLLAWEFEMDLKLICSEIEAEENIKIKLVKIPREIMEKNRTEVLFFEIALLEAKPVYQKGDKEKKTVDIKLTDYIPSLAEVPEKELKALRERASDNGFDFIDFWAVDFDYNQGKPFEHHWQDYRTRKDRTLKTISDQNYIYPKKGKYTACVKVIDVFGADTSITVDIDYD